VTTREGVQQLQEVRATKERKKRLEESRKKRGSLGGSGGDKYGEQPGGEGRYKTGMRTTERKTKSVQKPKQHH